MVPAAPGIPPGGMEVDASILRLRDLRKVREQGDARFELFVPALDLRAGQFVALVGDSGCGKSTLLDILALVSRPDRCACFEFNRDGDPRHGVDVRALWNTGQESRLAAIRRRDLGYVLQTGGLMPFLSVEENIRLPMRILGAPISQAEIEQLAERIDIRAVLSKKPQYLSGGQRQRAAILRALVHQPGLILADEPTAAVDKRRARAIVADFKRLALERRATIVMVTHDQELVRDLADVTHGFEVTPISSTSSYSVCRPC